MMSLPIWQPGTMFICMCVGGSLSDVGSLSLGGSLWDVSVQEGGSLSGDLCDRDLHPLYISLRPLQRAIRILLECFLVLDAKRFRKHTKCFNFQQLRNSLRPLC